MVLWMESIPRWWWISLPTKIQLEPCEIATAQEVIRGLKRWVRVKGDIRTIVTDQGKTFVSARVATWLRTRNMNMYRLYLMTIDQKVLLKGATKLFGAPCESACLLDYMFLGGP